MFSSARIFDVKLVHGGCAAFLHSHPRCCSQLILSDVLEPLFLGGLTDSRSTANKTIIEKVARDHDIRPESIKSWIYRRRAKEKRSRNEGELTGENNGTKVLHPVEEISIPSPSKISPLVLDRWQHYLQDCKLPDKEYVLDGIANGFSLDSRPKLLHSVRWNLASAERNPEAVGHHIRMLVDGGTISGPYRRKPYPNTHVSSIGLIPKKTGGWRLIADLSSPAGACVNDGISKEDSAVEYVGIKAAVAKVLKFGPGCLLSKFDLADAYRMIAIRSEERYQLVYRWDDYYYVDLCLPFGGRSSPRIFTRFSDILEWILTRHGPVDGMQHMLDDFFICSPPAEGIAEASRALTRSLELCSELGVPIRHTKVVQPTTSMLFLGLEFDTESMEVRIPQDKLDKTQRRLLDALSSKTIAKRQLLSLVGMLYFCSQCVSNAGGEMLERLHEAARLEDGRHQVELANEYYDYLGWWMDRLDGWNGRSLMEDFDFEKDDYTKFFS